MPQMLLPFFSCGVTHINQELAFKKEDGCVTYFNASMPVFQHAENDIQSFKMIVSQFYVMGVAKQSEIVRAFGVNKLLVKRAVKLSREQGPKGFFKPPKRRGPGVLIEAVVKQAQDLLDRGKTPAEISKTLKLKVDTVRKAIRSGRLHRTDKSLESEESAIIFGKSDRMMEDSQAGMGVGATDVMGRMLASVGVGSDKGVSLCFSPAKDVSGGGVLLALPALLAVGLLRHTEEHFSLPRGYYGMMSIFLMLAFMALWRIQSMEGLRYHPPGEWGKLLGLDRVPEVRTVREKVKILANQGEPILWSAALCRDWMEESPEQARTLYIDGHVRVYHGSQTTLPRHYVSRQRLCLRATVDYWINAMDGQPFFVLHQEVDPGLVQVIENEVIPLMEKGVPGQPTEEEIERYPLLSRFKVICDRESYSPEMMSRLWKKRIALMTYRKFPGEDWPVDEFMEYDVILAGGETTRMYLAERGVFLGGVIWVREFRRLKASGHQTAIVTTDYQGDMPRLSAAMFARWSQENFFAYMKKHYGLDKLITYETEAVADTKKLINPEYRRLDGEVRKNVSLLNRLEARFGSMSLECDIAPGKVEAFEQKKAEIQEELGLLKEKILDLKDRRKKVQRHITYGELPEEGKFERLAVNSKHMIDTVKMVVYRAETAMANILREKLSREDDARSLLRAIYATEADIIPDEKNGMLTIRLHNLASRMQNEALKYLCDELNATETTFPGTKFQIIYEMVAS